MDEEASTDGEAVVEPAATDETTTAATTEPVETDEFEGIIDLDAAPEAEDEPTEAEASTDDEATEGEDEAEEDDESAVEMREFDFGGNKLEVDASQIPAELADKIDEFTKGTWSDYTRKAQANAETAKSLATQQDAVAKLTELNGEALQTYSKGLQLRSEIEQLESVDLQSLWQSNPDQARRVSDTLAAKQAEFQSTIALVGQQENSVEQMQQSEIVRRTAEGTTALDQRIKNFSTEKVNDVIEYVTSRGMSQADAAGWALNPEVTEYAYKAMLFDRMQAKAGKPTPTKAKPMKAIKSGGAATNSNDPSKMSMGQLQKHLGL